MTIARAFCAVALAATAMSCGQTPASNASCDDMALCASELTVTIRSESGQPFAAGMYAFELVFDGVRTNTECSVEAPTAGQGSRCLGESQPEPVTPVFDNLQVVGFRVTGPAAARAVVSVRSLCPTRELAVQTFEPTYACATGCRSAHLTMTVKGGEAGFTICPDAGTG